MTQASKVPGAILYRVPIYESGPPGIDHQGTELFIGLDRIQDQDPSNQLVKELPECELVASRGILIDDLIHATEELTLLGLKATRDIFNEWHLTTSCLIDPIDEGDAAEEAGHDAHEAQYHVREPVRDHLDTSVSTFLNFESPRLM